MSPNPAEVDDPGMDSDGEGVSHRPAVEPERPGHRRRRHRRSWLYRKLRRFKLVRIFRKDRPFAFIFAIGAVIALAVGLAVPRLWNTAPADFPRGPVEVSLIDLLQASSLAKSAGKAMAAGHYDLALFTWQRAVANNQGDARLHRGLLTCLRDGPEARPDLAGLALGTSWWLLALSATNGADIALAADVLERYGQTRAALGWLADHAAGVDPEVDKVLARCLFSAGRYEAFDHLWRANQAAWSSDSRLAPYRDAWLVATDDRSGGLESALRLKAALESPAGDGLLAARLLLQAASQRGLVEDAARCVRRLEEGHSATVEHHAYLWRLLARSGQLAEATNRAAAFRGVPREPESAARLIEAYRDLGLRDAARGYLEAHIGDYGTDPGIWRLYFELLLDLGTWNEVQRVTANARGVASRTDPLWVEALFADYRAAQAQDRKREADELVANILTFELADPEIALRLAARWRADGRPRPALQVLRAVEARLADSPAFWAECFQTGRALGDLELLRRSVAQLLRLDPGSPAWANNRAALLLITGEDPAEALQLTFEAQRRQPDSVPLRINHAIALVRNGRAPEAARLLEGIAADRLEPDLAANYHLALVEVRAAEGRSTEAAAAAARIDRTRLLAPQVERLDRLLKAGGAAVSPAP